MATPFSQCASSLKSLIQSIRLSYCSDPTFKMHPESDSCSQHGSSSCHFFFLDLCNVLLPGFALSIFAPSSKHYYCSLESGFFPSWEDCISWGFWLVLGNGVWVGAQVPCGPSRSLSPCQWRCQLSVEIIKPQIEAAWIMNHLCRRQLPGVSLDFYQILNEGKSNHVFVFHSEENPKSLEQPARTLYNIHYYLSVFNFYYFPLCSLHSFWVSLRTQRIFLLWVLCTSCFLCLPCSQGIYMATPSPSLDLCKEWYYQLITSFNSLSALGTHQLFLYLCFLLVCIAIWHIIYFTCLVIYCLSSPIRMDVSWQQRYLCFLLLLPHCSIVSASNNASYVVGKQ